MARSTWPDPVSRRRVGAAEISRFALTGGLAYLVDIVVFNVGLVVGRNHLAAKAGMGLATVIRFWGFRRLVSDTSRRERNDAQRCRGMIDLMAADAMRPPRDAGTTLCRVPGGSVHIGEDTKMRVLVVEDEAQLAETVRRGLNAEGFNVEVAVNGKDGLWAASETNYDVIVLDIMLPKLNGYQVVEQLRQREVWTPILMLTAKDGEYDLADAFDLGADDYLTKPFSFIVLVARLRALVRRGAPARPVVLTAGDLQLDPARRMVRRGETVITLTPREFGLFEHLMRHRGDVTSKLEILESVWDQFYDGDPNVVEVYVGYLRRKIDAPFGRQAIETVRGMGYRLAADGG